jgi:hypothetical protein
MFTSLSNRLIDQIGEWNPQLFREIKGRLKKRNLMIVGTIAFIGQFLFYLAFQAQIPVPNPLSTYPITNKLCTGGIKEYDYLPKCILNQAGGFDINWTLWWREFFLYLSIIGVFALIVGGVYLLINDLAQEEKRGTLNFIRLSPQSANSILTGKILGVPILLYLLAFATLPLHFYAGISGAVNLSFMVCFYIILTLSCLFFYSSALLFGLFGTVFSGFQPWLGSGAVLFFLSLALGKPIVENPIDWLNLFSPTMILGYIPRITTGKYYYGEFSLDYLHLEKLQFFNFPVGENPTIATALILINFAVGTYCVWTSLHRRYLNPNKPIMTKGQSYLLVPAIQIILLGFAVNKNTDDYMIEGSFYFILGFNLVLFLALIAALSPQRQTLLDWARYSYENKRHFWHTALIKDLLFHEQSPAILTIAMNLGVMAICLGIWATISFNQSKAESALYALMITITMTMIYAVLAQTILFLRTNKASQIAAGAIAGLTILPVPVLLFLSLEPYKHPLWWMFTALPWAGMREATATSVFIAFLSQLSIFTLLSFNLKHQLNKAGQSETKALLSEGKI